MSAGEYAAVRTGAGWAVAHLDELGEGPGFRKVRRGLDVTAFGVNAIVLPPGLETGFHYHDEQEELYFVHSGAIEMEFGDGSVHKLEAGGRTALFDAVAATPARIARKNPASRSTPDSRCRLGSTRERMVRLTSA